MVKHILARVKEGMTLSIPALESIGEAITNPYISRHEPRHSTYGHNELVGKSEKYAGTSTR